MNQETSNVPSGAAVSGWLIVDSRTSAVRQASCVTIQVRGVSVFIASACSLRVAGAKTTAERVGSRFRHLAATVIFLAWNARQIA